MTASMNAPIVKDTNANIKIFPFNETLASSAFIEFLENMIPVIKATSTARTWKIMIKRAGWA